MHLGKDGALYADLHYLKSHEMAESVCEAAERNPTLYSLSHNADAAGAKDADGWFVIDQITEVRSVDLVDTGATNKSLFEHKEEARISQVKVWSVLEAVSRNGSASRKLRRRLLEAMDGPMQELDGDAGPAMDEPPAEASPEEQLKAGFRAAIVAILDDDSLDAAGKAKKVGDYLKTHEKLIGSQEKEAEKAAEEAEDEEEPDGDEEEVKEGDDEEEKDVKEACDDKKDVKESRKAKRPVSGVIALTEATAKTLCKLVEIPASVEVLESIVGLDRDRAEKVLLAYKTGRTAQDKPRTAPRSGAPGAPSRNGTGSDDVLKRIGVG